MSDARRQKQAPENQQPSGLWKKAAIIGVVLLVAGGLYYYDYHNRAHKYDAFARCLSSRGAKMYGAYWCPHCAEQKEMFADSFEYAPYVECGVPGNVHAESQECKDAGIKHFPTWQFPPNGERVEAVLPMIELSNRTSCPLP